MTTDPEIIRLRADNLRLEAVQLLERFPGVPEFTKTAIDDLAKVLISEHGLEQTSAGLRFSSGDDLSGAVAAALINNPHYRVSPVTNAKPKSDVSGLSAHAKLDLANGVPAPRLN